MFYSPPSGHIVKISQTDEVGGRHFPGNPSLSATART